MPRIQQAQRRVGGFREQISPQVPQGFFTEDIRGEIAAAEQRRRSAAGEAQAAGARAQVFGQAARLADNVGVLASNIALRDAQNTAVNLKTNYDVDELTTVREMAALVEKNVFGTEPHQRPISEFTDEWSKRMAKHKAKLDAGAKNLPAFIRDQLDAQIKIQSTKQNLKISIQQAQLVQDSGTNNILKRIQLTHDKIAAGEQELESGQADIKAQYAFGKKNGYFLDNPTTTKAEQRDLDKAASLSQNHNEQVMDRAAINLAQKLNASNFSRAQKRLTIAKSGLDAQRQRDAQGIVDRFDSAVEIRDEQQEIADGIALSTAQQDGTITWEMIRNSSVPDKEARRKTMNAEAKRAAAGVPIRTNQRSLAGLRELVISVGRGSKTLIEMQEELDLARFGREKKGGGREYVSGRRPDGAFSVVSNAPLINDAEYAKARTDAAKELDRDIADAEQIRYSEARNLFLGFEAGGLDPSSPDFVSRFRAAAAGRGETQRHSDIRLEFLAKYGDEMRNYIVANEDRIRNEGTEIFYTFAAQRRIDYQGFVEQAIAQDKAETPVDIGNLPAVPPRVRSGDTSPLPTGGEPTITSKKEWDKLQPGSLFRDKDGNLRRKP